MSIKMSITQECSTNFKVIDSNVLNEFDLYSKIRTEFRETSILESLGVQNDDTARYTIMGIVAREKLVVYGQECLLENLDNHYVKNADFLETLDKWVNIKSNSGFADTPLQTGVIGYIGYEMKHYFEKYDKRISRDIKCPDAYLVRYSLLHITDKSNNKSYWVAERGVDERIIEKLEQTARSESVENSFFKVLGDIVPDFDKESYLNIIRRTIDYIKEGDIFQANITMRFTGQYIGSPFTLYTHLRKTTPNPFFCYLDFEYPVLSTSPERFFKISHNYIYTYPIKGTIRCEIDGQDQKETLLNSKKDMAENTMITDLLRNDIGRVCTQGSVDVTTLCGIKRFNNLYHLESIIKGRLKDNVHFSQVLSAVFPGGSITGAPKIRATDIIEELELKLRGPYTGAIGFFGNNGYVDTCIAIRTIYFEEGRFYYHAGGGIVVQSQPEHEYEELILKTSGICSSLSEFNILKKQRSRIDRIDSEVIRLLCKRFKAIKEVGEIKSKYNISLLQNNRVSEIMNERERMAQKLGGIPPGLVSSIFMQLIDAAMSEEQREKELKISEN